jgi:hypothetical protein
MQEGFVLESGHGSRSPTLWVSGSPEGGSFLGSKTSGKEQHPIQALRCQGCRFLEMYA